MDEDKVLAYLNNRLAVLPDLASSYTFDKILKKKKPWRPMYFKIKKKVANFINSGRTDEIRRILMIPGLRGVGKTTLIFQIYESFSSSASRNNIIYVDCNDLKANGIRLNELLEVYEKKIIGKPFERISEKIIILIDETHSEPDWESVVKSLNNRSQNVYFILTGSSSIALENSADLARRRETEWLFPMRFFEYIMMKTFKEKTIYPPKDYNTSERIQNTLFSDMSVQDCLANLEIIDKKLSNEYFSMIPLMQQEQERYLYGGGFPFIIHEEHENLVFQSIMDILKRVIETDLPIFTSLGSRNLPKVMPILQILSASVDRVSYETIGSGLGLAKSRVSDILKSLEKSGVIFGVKPYGNIEKIVSSSWKHYFTTPTLRAALLWSIGKFDKSSYNLGLLLETYTANILYRAKVLRENLITDFFFSPDQGCSDFLIKSQGCNIVMECGWGEKNAKQVKDTMAKFSSEKGIVVSRTELKLEDGILFVPIRLFYMA